MQSHEAVGRQAVNSDTQEGDAQFHGRITQQHIPPVVVAGTGRTIRAISEQLAAGVVVLPQELRRVQRLAETGDALIEQEIEHLFVQIGIGQRFGLPRRRYHRHGASDRKAQPLFGQAFVGGMIEKPDRAGEGQHRGRRSGVREPRQVGGPLEDPLVGKQILVAVADIVEHRHPRIQSGDNRFLRGGFAASGGPGIRAIRIVKRELR